MEGFRDEVVGAERFEAARLPDNFTPNNWTPA